MGMVSEMMGMFMSPVAIRNDSVYVQIERNLKTGMASLSLSVLAPNEVVEQLEALLKSHCYTLLANKAASGLKTPDGAAIFNLSKRL